MKSKKKKIPIIIILIFLILELCFMIVRYNHTTYAETKDSKFQVFAISDRYNGYAYVWYNLNIGKNNIDKIKNLKISVLDENSDVLYTSPIENPKDGHIPILKKANLKNSLYTGLSLFNKNLESIIMIDYSTPKHTIIEDSEEYWKYKIEYEYNGEVFEEIIKPQRTFRIPDDTLIEILISHVF